MISRFTAARRGGSGTPLVGLHGFTDTWRTWELVLPTLERHHDVLAPTLIGHAGGPPPTSRRWSPHRRAAAARPSSSPPTTTICPQLDVPTETAHLITGFTAS